ncbi:MAG: PaaI family thioesterase [Actinomycetota bacterium]|nr:PaaI family thioesterase [Actinomycetota bacterium]
METDLGTQLVTGWLAASPFGKHVGVIVASIEAGHAEIVLPFDASLCTMGNVVHGGAIATLIDTAATAAAWAGAEPPANGRGATVSMALNYVGAAVGTDLRARASVVKRGRNLVFCDVEVRGADNGAVATAIVTYKLG